MKKQGNKIFITIILVIFFVMLILSATFIIIKNNISFNRENGVIAFGSRSIFTSSSSNEMSLNISSECETKDSPYFCFEANENVNIILSTSNDIKSTCEYKMYWVWDDTLNVANQYSKTSNQEKELTISGTNGEDSFDEIQLSSYADSILHKMLLVESSITVNNSTQANQTWNVNVRFYKTSEDQLNHQDKTYQGKIVVEDVVCSKIES